MLRTTTSALLSFVLAAIASLVPAYAAQVQHDKIDALNQAFRGFYAIARQESIERAEPILIVRRESLTLVRHGSTTVEQYFPEESDTLKVVDHISLAIFAALAHDPEHPNKDRLQRLQSLRDSIVAARSQVAASPFKPDTLQRQNKMIDQDLTFLNFVLDNKGCTAASLHDFIRAIEPSTDDNIRESVGLELAALYKAMDRIHASLTPQEWKSMHVVVFSSHMARAQQMHFQYFQRLLDQTEEGDRLVFCEGKSEDKDALDLVGTHGFDAEIAEAYFGDAWRMHRDLLSAATSQYLDEHPVK